MDDRKEKTEQIVKSIKVLESVHKTSTDMNQKIRVKEDIKKLRIKLKDMYPETNLKDLEEAVFSELMTIDNYDKSLRNFKYLNDIEVEVVSNYKEDSEINEVGSIMSYFEERIWIAVSEQHMKLDFSNSGERDTLYRKLDECNRAFKMFCQTIEDLERARSTDYISQLHLMRVRHGRLFLFEIYYFFKSVKDFIYNLISAYNTGGNLILNPDELIEYEDYEEYKTFEGKTVIDALSTIDEFVDEVLYAINVPDLKEE